MKNVKFYNVLAGLAALMLLTISAKAQYVNCNVFLQGNYLEVGINTNGAFGSSVPAPSGYHARGSANASLNNACGNTCSDGPTSLGLVGDPAKDGWTVGSPAFYGDYFLPGVPQEGWSIEVNGSQANAWNETDVCSAVSLFSPGLSGSNISAVGTQSGTWQGGYAGLAITQVTSVNPGDLFLTVTVTLTNTTGATLNNVYYQRNVDPDNEEAISGILMTNNNVDAFLPNAQNSTLVSATGITYGAYLGLGTLDCRAKGYIVKGGLSPTDNMDIIYSGSSSNYYYSGSNTADVGIGLVFNLGNIDPGPSASVTFTYAYLLDAADLNNVFPTTTPGYDVAGDPTSPHASGATTNVCQNSTQTVTIDGGGSGYTWAWSSSNTAISLSPATGTTTTLNVGTSPVTLTAVGYPNCTGQPVTVTVILDPTMTVPDAGSISIVGTLPLCSGFGLTASDGAGGGAGTWINGDGTVALLDPFGNVTAIATGTDAISYAVTNSCGTSYATTTLTVNPVPDAGTITAPEEICANTSILLGESVTGGTWSVDDPLQATIDPLGNLTGVDVSGGTVNVTYTVTGVCGTPTAIATASVFVFQLYPINASSDPNGTISPAGTTNVCFLGNQTYTMTPNTGFHIADVETDEGSVLADVVYTGDVGTYTFVGVFNPDDISVTYAPNSIVTTSGCLTNSLIINTGYDPTTGSAITGGANSGTPVPDPHWFVAAVSPGIVTAAAAITPIPGIVVSPTGNADVITTFSAWINNPAGQPGGWISCLNSNTYTTDGTGPSPAGTLYSTTLSRSFNMCLADNVTFNLNFSDDNWVSSIDVDGTIIYSNDPENVPATFTSFANVLQTLPLSCGSHTINIVANNFNLPIVSGNPMGLDVYGTVTATGNSIVSETSACTTYTCIPTITSGGNVIQGNDPGSCSAVVSSYPVPITTGSSPVITYSPAAGSTFALGVTTVTATATTSCGTASCTFTVTIQDTEKPTITAPGPIVLNGYCNPVAVALGTPTVADNCGTPTYTNDAPALFPVGPTTVTWTVNDGNGNSATATQLVTINPATLVFSTHIDNVSCNGGYDGHIDADVSGGTSPYTYTWSTGGSGLAIYDDLYFAPFGTYTVSVTDAHGCSLTASYNVTQPLALGLTATTSSVSCNGGNNGSINTTVTGGTGSYHYSWSNGSHAADPSGLTAGTYFVTVTDDHGCSICGSYTITQPAAISLTGTTTTNVNCNGGSNGSITTSVSGGPSAAYTYSWSNGSHAANLTGLAAGTYTLTVTSGGCTKTATYTITQPAALGITAVVANVSCNGSSNGSINSTVTGGTTPYSYHWSNGCVAADPTGLAMGTYTVTVTDAHGCTTTGSYNVTQPAAISITPTITNVTCNGSSNGSISLAVAGGTPSYSYHWSSGCGTANPSSLAAGTYTVTVTDAHGCTKTGSYTITQPAAMTITGSATNVSCNGSHNGSVTISSVTGGASGYSYSYSWSNGAHTESISSVAAGTYTLTVTDAHGCTATHIYTVTQPSALAASISVSPVYCVSGSSPYTIYLGYGPTSVTLSASATGGTTGYTYHWMPGSGSSASISVSPTTTTTYTLTVTDAHGCTSTTTQTITVDDIRCSDGKSVYVCHYGGTISCGTSAVPGHISHGDYCGPCHKAGSKTTGTDDNGSPVADEDDDVIKVYPNPSEGLFNIEIPSIHKDAVVMITDLTGRVLENRTITNNTGEPVQFNLNNVARGIYLVKVNAGDKIYVDKLIVR